MMNSEFIVMLRHAVLQVNSSTPTCFLPFGVWLFACHCSGTAGFWYVSGPLHETRTDLRQDVRRVWYASVLILSETIGNRTCKAVREPFCRWLNVLPFWKRTLWWGPWGSHWDLLSSRYSFINMTTQPHPVAFPTPGHSSRGLMNLFWILSPPDRNYIPSFCYNKERNWCESASCRLPSEFISILQTRLPTPPICAPHPHPTPANAKKSQQIQRPQALHDVQLTPPFNKTKHTFCTLWLLLVLSLETSLVVIICVWPGPGVLRPLCAFL